MVGINLEALCNQARITVLELRARLNSEGIGASGHGRQWESQVINLIHQIIREKDPA
jgi:hypothetical protein